MQFREWKKQTSQQIVTMAKNFKPEFFDAYPFEEENDHDEN